VADKISQDYENRPQDPDCRDLDGGLETKQFQFTEYMEMRMDTEDLHQTFVG